MTKAFAKQTQVFLIWRESSGAAVHHPESQADRALTNLPRISPIAEPLPYGYSVH